jgi:hypothetical protein
VRAREHHQAHESLLRGHWDGTEAHEVIQLISLRPGDRAATMASIETSDRYPSGVGQDTHVELERGELVITTQRHNGQALACLEPLPTTRRMRLSGARFAQVGVIDPGRVGCR